jgi:hypothetical protein
MGRWTWTRDTAEFPPELRKWRAEHARRHALVGRRRPQRLGAIALMVAAAAAGLASLASGSPRRAGNPSGAVAPANALPKDTQLLYVGGAARVQPIRPGFVGLSLEYPAVTRYAGTDANALNPIFLQLIRNLAPGQSPVIRIGGDSTDWTWWPVPGMAKPGGVRDTLTPSWLAVTRALARNLKARLILGLNLESARRRILAEEAKQLSSGLPGSSIEAFEPGNEPELYGSFVYYRSHGRGVTGRPADYSFSRFERDFAGARNVLGGLPLAGPTMGTLTWMPLLHEFLASEPRLSLVTLHRYPLQVCFFPRSSPRYPTISSLLSPASSRGLAEIFPPYVALVHSRGLQLRIDEINTIGCGNANLVARSFASALWALDTLSALAARGVDGVNVHTYRGATYELFTFDQHGRRWTAHVEPEYYGLLMFALAEPPGAQPLNLYGPGTGALSAYATRGHDGITRVLLVNESGGARDIGIRAGVPATQATIIRLTAPDPASLGHVTLGGLGFGPQTPTGLLSGQQSSELTRAVGHVFGVHVPAYSAALVLLPK